MSSNRSRVKMTRRAENFNSPRQLPPTATASTFNWWPYPPWGAATSSVAQTPAIALVTTTVQSIQSATPTTETLPSDIHSRLVSSSLSPSLSSNSTSSADIASTTSPSDTQSMVTITGTRDSQSAAPSDSVVEYPKVHPGSNTVNINLILIVVFVVIGVLVGGIIAWFAYGCLNRKRWRKRRRSELEVGPSIFSKSGELDEYSREKVSLRGDDEEQGDHDDDSSWHALDIHDPQPPSERAAFLGHQPVNPAFLAPAPSTRKPPSASRGLYRAKTGASMSVYSQIGDDDDMDTASFVGEHSFDPRSPRAPPSKTPTRRRSKLSTLTRCVARQLPLLRLRWPAPISRALSLSRRRPTCPRDGSSSSTENTGSLSYSRNADKDLSRANTSKTTTTIRTVGTAMGFRIVEESPLPTPLSSPPTSSDGLSGFSWAGVGEMIWGNVTSDRDSSDRYTNLPDREGRNGQSPVKKKSTGSSSTRTTRTNRTRSKSLVAAEERTRGKDAGVKVDQERRLRDYYGYGSDSHHNLPRSPPQITSPKLEETLCFSPVIGQGR
ncbi:hypothetical protein AAF712_004796 [Marasmius tenuissimus]|uniref:Uncharacterized protein n=1 Tax=Marasmius tenuissimus TaxID=585030 RepID=A0ABR3A2C6_9AGAR